MKHYLQLIKKILVYKKNSNTEQINNDIKNINNIANQKILSLSDKIQSKYIPKIPEYKFDIEKLYNDPNFEYEKIPYLFEKYLIYSEVILVMLYM